MKPNENEDIDIKNENTDIENNYENMEKRKCCIECLHDTISYLPAIIFIGLLIILVICYFKLK